jgi:hypothetical protein
MVPVSDVVERYRVSDATNTAVIVTSAIATMYEASAPRPYGSSAVAINGDRPPAITDDEFDRCSALGRLPDVPVVDSHGRRSDRDHQEAREHQDDRRAEVVLEMFRDEVADVCD